MSLSTSPDLVSPDVVSLDVVLARQAGVVTRAQALAAGLARTTVDERVRSRRWVPLHPCVYLAGNRAPDAEARVRAALLWAGDSALLSGRAAAWWHGLLAEPPPTIAVAIGPVRRLRSHADVVVRRRAVPPVDRATHRGLAVTGRALTVIEAAVELGAAAPSFLDGALRRSVPFAEVQDAHRRASGEAGSAAASALLTAAAHRSRTAARGELLALLRTSGASGWTPDVEIAGRPVDAAFPAARVAVVAAGWTEPRRVDPHADPDGPRPPGLVARGWTLLRFPVPDIVERPRSVLAEISRQVAHGMATHGTATHGMAALGVAALRRAC